jgi:hypothetical protein
MGMPSVVKVLFMKKSLGATTIAHPAPAWVIGTSDCVKTIFL